MAAGTEALPPLEVVDGEGLRAATDAFQRRWIDAALGRHGGAMAAAAREAGMDRSNFHRLAVRLGVNQRGLRP